MVDIVKKKNRHALVGAYLLIYGPYIVSSRCNEHTVGVAFNTHMTPLEFIMRMAKAGPAARGNSGGMFVSSRT